MSVVKTHSNLRVLVAIASYGEKNIEYLKRVINQYRSMAMTVDIVVLSEAPKSVDLGVEVRVGTPARNPHSLPFAHKQLFADNVDRYDLFVYTEDDIEASESNIRAFVRISEVLAPSEIAGYVRFEAAAGGDRTLPDVHGRFHWKPDSVTRRGDYVIAEFTNEHAGFFVLRNDQLRQALASGTFLRAPYEGRYEMLESAATDVYVHCGFRKVIAISHLDDFMVHHMPNRYVGQLGVPLSAFREQISTLMQIEHGVHPATTLCETEPPLLGRDWAKRYDERPSDELLTLLPRDAMTVLSVGCGSGVTERALQQRGATVTVLPLDSVAGAPLARRGMHVVYGTLDECLRRLRGRQFDCVMVTNLIQLLPNPSDLLRQVAALVAPGGSLVIEAYNVDHFSVLIKRAVGAGQFSKIRRFSESGIQMYRVTDVKKIMRQAGLEVRSLLWSEHSRRWPLMRVVRYAGRFGARTWLLRAQRPVQGTGH